MRYVTEREGGGILDMHATDKKSGKPVVDVLRSKHPAKCIPEKLEDLAVAPPLLHIDISQEIVEEVAKKWVEELALEVLMPPSYNYG